MENREQNRPVPNGTDQQIQLVLNNPDTEEDTIDLGAVFHNMKLKSRIFAWVLVLCLLVGICAPLVMYQFTKQPLTVSSVVTLRYEHPVLVQQRNAQGQLVWVVPENAQYEEVSDLTAPDGKDLDLGMVTSSYVLQSALNGMTLSTPITASQLGANLRVRTILTEESQRSREALQGLHEAKNVEAYNRLESTEMKYRNQFVVSLTNGFLPLLADRTVPDGLDGDPGEHPDDPRGLPVRHGQRERHHDGQKRAADRVEVPPAQRPEPAGPGERKHRGNEAHPGHL